MFTDHQALKALINTPHPSGKLARWGMTLQELDLEIQYRAGKTNSNADSLSRNPNVGQEADVMLTLAVDEGPNHNTLRRPDHHLIGLSERSNHTIPGASESSVVPVAKEGTGPAAEEGHGNHKDSIPGAQTGTGGGQLFRSVGTHTLSDQQANDPELGPIVTLVHDGIAPADPKLARTLAAERTMYEVVDDILYRVEGEALKIVPPAHMCDDLVHSLHGGLYGAHLGVSKTYGRLRTHYWWRGMRKFVAEQCQSCLTCRSRYAGHPTIAPMTPIPVGGPSRNLVLMYSNCPSHTVGRSMQSYSWTISPSGRRCSQQQIRRP